MYSVTPKNHRGNVCMRSKPCYVKASKSKLDIETIAIRYNSKILLTLNIDGKDIYKELDIGDYMAHELLKHLGCKRIDVDYIEDNDDVLALFNKNNDPLKWELELH